MSKEQMMQEFVSSTITPLLERVVVKKLIQSFDVIAEKQKAELAAAKARIAELEEALEPFADWYEQPPGKFDPVTADHCATGIIARVGDLRRAAALLNKEAL